MTWKFLKDILTEDDNETYCIARFAVLVGIFGYLVVSLIQVAHNGVINLSDMGIGLGTLLGGGGVLVGGKAATEHDAIKPTQQP